MHYKFTRSCSPSAMTNALPSLVHVAAVMLSPWCMGMDSCCSALYSVAQALVKAQRSSLLGCHTQPLQNTRRKKKKKKD